METQYTTIESIEHLFLNKNLIQERQSFIKNLFESYQTVGDKFRINIVKICGDRIQGFSNYDERLPVHAISFELSKSESKYSKQNVVCYYTKDFIETLYSDQCFS